MKTGKTSLYFISTSDPAHLTWADSLPSLLFHLYIPAFPSGTGTGYDHPALYLKRSRGLWF